MQWVSASTRLLNIHFACLYCATYKPRLLFLLYSAFLFCILRFSFYFSLHSTCSLTVLYMDKGNSCVCQLQVYIKNIISIKLGGIKYKTSSELCLLNKSVFVPGEVKPRIDFAKAGCPDKKNWCCFEQFQEDFKRFWEDCNFSPEVLGVEQTVLPLIKGCNSVYVKIY